MLSLKSTDTVLNIIDHLLDVQDFTFELTFPHLDLLLKCSSGRLLLELLVLLLCLCLYEFGNLFFLFLLRQLIIVVKEILKLGKLNFVAILH